MRPIEWLAGLLVDANFNLHAPFPAYRLGCWLYGIDLKLGIKRGKHVLNPDFRDEIGGAPMYIDA